jgi:flagellar assembly factor FliW
MTVNTTHFGTIAIDEASTIEFPEGLPGFECCRRFVPLEAGNAAGLIFLQSLESPQLCFLTILLRSLCPDYRLAMSAEERELLGLDSIMPVEEHRLVLLEIVSLAEGEEPTANLLAPVAIHPDTRRAVQVVRTDGLYPLRAELRVGESVCS